MLKSAVERTSRFRINMDRLTPERRSENMRRIKSKGMKPELTIRRLAHRLGYRFRLHRSDLPGNPDLVFPSRRAVIFVHGCFWHQHPDANCKAAHSPRSNTDYWGPKLTRNTVRDAESQKRLAELGWRVLVVWECELKHAQQVEEKLRGYLESNQTGEIP